MKQEQKEIVRETWALVMPIADTAATLFYDRLFEIDPTARPLFRDDGLAEQRRKLMQTLDHLVQRLDNLEALTPAIEDLGRRHVQYGVREAHYDSVGAALLWTLEQGLGDRWSADAREAWSNVYGLTAGIMQQAARDATPAA